MNKPKPTRMLAGAMLLCPMVVAVAQTLPPDPAAVMNEHIRRMENSAPGNKAPIPAEPITPASVAPTTTGTVMLKEIQFSASTLLDADELRELGSRYVGRTLRSADLQSLMDALVALYRQKGILTAQPVLPQQNLGNGVLKVLLVEGRLGEMKVRQPGHGDPDWVSRWFDLTRGEVVTNEALQSRLGRFNASSDMLATAEFVPGAGFGLTDLAIDVQANRRAQFWSFAETQTSGSDMVAAGVRVAPVGRTGGKFELAALATADAQTLSLAEFWPIGVQGWRAGISGSVSQSRTSVLSETEGPDLKVRGDSNTLSVEVGRNWVLSTPWSLGTSINWGTLRSRTSVMEEVLLDQKRHRLTLASTFNYATSPTQATVRLGLMSSSGDSKRFEHLDLSTQLQTVLDNQGYWHGRLNGFARLATSGEAFTSEQLILGGTDTVRGFDPGAATGDKGSALQLELRYRIQPAQIQSSEVFVFVDAGQTSSADSSQDIASIGAGLQARITQNLSTDLVWSRQLQSAQSSPNRLQFRLVGIW